MCMEVHHHRRRCLYRCWILRWIRAQLKQDLKYYLVAYDESNDVEVFRHEVIMDLAFSDNFGFDL